MFDINVIKETFKPDGVNDWSYHIDLMEKEWDIENDEEIEQRAEAILEKHGIMVIEDNEYEKLSDEEKDEDAIEFLKVLYEQYEDFIEKHIAFILTKSINLADEAYCYICFDLVAREVDKKTTLEKLYEWKNTAINHKYIVGETIKSIEKYFNDYLYLDIYKELFPQIIFFKEQWNNVITYFINLLVEKIDDCNEGKRYELYK